MTDRERAIKYRKEARRYKRKYFELKRATEQAGHWIEFELPINNYATSTRWKCNICDGRVEHISNYCPNCGCRMVEPQESEDKE